MTHDRARYRRLVTELVRSPDEGWLLVRMTAWSLALPVLKRTVSLPNLARLMWRDGRIRSSPDVDDVARLAALVARRRPGPGRDNCLERSLLAYRYLSALGSKPHLVVAVRGGESLVEGHVWVTLHGEPVFPEDVQAFVPIVELGERGKQIQLRDGQ